MYPNVENIHFEENSERLKIVMPVAQNWLLIGLYSVLLLTGLGLMIGCIIYFFQIASSGARFAFSFSCMLIIFFGLTYYLTRYIFRQWQFMVANREILFINREELVVRRPVSLLGITTAYDMQHVRPFQYSSEYNATVFDYGSQPVLIARNLPPDQISPVIDYLNDRFFPDLDDEDDE